MFDLKKGDHGVAVQILQMLLNSYLVPSPNLQENGPFEDPTDRAVRQYQKSQKLQATGKVEKHTWKALGMSALHHPMPAIRDIHSWMRIAQAELLIHEHSIGHQQNKRIIEYHQTTSYKATDDHVPWCSAFVNWVMIEAGYKGTNNAAAKSWENWGTKLVEPRSGAIAVVKKRLGSQSSTAGTPSGFHVAFLVDSTPSGTIRLLGGNQSHKVKYSDFHLNQWDIKAYRWPSS